MTDQSPDSGRVDRLSFLDRLSPKLYATVGHRDGIARHPVAAVLRFELRHELLILRAVETLEVSPRGIVADHIPNRERTQLLFGNSEGHERNFLGTETGRRKPLVERQIRIAGYRTENDIRPGLA